ncbi:MAG: hypothetical protein WCD86_23655 [Ktedonobacteraceae bacterium]
MPKEENGVIFGDVFQVKREFPISKNGRGYKEYRISDNRALRIRILHPGKAETATGADLIYENYWEIGSTNLVRLAVLQYKMWHKKSLYIDKRTRCQLEKMKNTFCGRKLCEENSDYKRQYRLPYCTAFLRPTDELQSEDASLLSSGYYVPICVVDNVRQSALKGQNTLRSRDIRSEAVTHKIFEEMFNSNMIGSRWLTYGELEDMYHFNNILEPDEHIVIHAQELPL